MTPPVSEELWWWRLQGDSYYTRLQQYNSFFISWITGLLCQTPLCIFSSKDSLGHCRLESVRGRSNGARPKLTILAFNIQDRLKQLLFLRFANCYTHLVSNASCHGNEQISTLLLEWLSIKNNLSANTVSIRVSLDFSNWELSFYCSTLCSLLTFNQSIHLISFWGEVADGNRQHAGQPTCSESVSPSRTLGRLPLLWRKRKAEKWFEMS